VAVIPRRVAEGSAGRNVALRRPPSWSARPAPLGPSDRATGSSFDDDPLIDHTARGSPGAGDSSVRRDDGGIHAPSGNGCDDLHLLRMLTCTPVTCVSHQPSSGRSMSLHDRAIEGRQPPAPDKRLAALRRGGRCARTHMRVAALRRLKHRRATDGDNRYACYFPGTASDFVVASSPAHVTSAE